MRYIDNLVVAYILDHHACHLLSPRRHRNTELGRLCWHATQLSVRRNWLHCVKLHLRDGRTDGLTETRLFVRPYIRPSVRPSVRSFVS